MVEIEELEFHKFGKLKGHAREAQEAQTCTYWNKVEIENDIGLFKN